MNANVKFCLKRGSEFSVSFPSSAVYLEEVAAAADSAIAILNKRNPNKDVSLCNCGVIEIIKILYDLKLPYCSLGSAHDMFISASNGSLGGLSTSPVLLHNIKDVIDEGIPVIVFGAWYGKLRRCGHVNLILGYDQNVLDNTPSKFFCLDTGGTGNNCRRKILRESACWRQAAWPECVFFKFS